MIYKSKNVVDECGEHNSSRSHNSFCHYCDFILRIY